MGLPLFFSGSIRSKCAQSHTTSLFDQEESLSQANPRLTWQIFARPLETENRHPF